MIRVLRAYTTDQGEEVLILADGRGVYLHPGYDEAIFAEGDDALRACTGVPALEPRRLAAWQAQGGYPSP